MSDYPFDINDAPEDATHYAGQPNGSPELVFYKMVKGKWKFTYPNETTWLSCRKGLTAYHPIQILYRIKPKSERELFIDKSKLIIGATTDDDLVDAVIADLFDAGARYKDLTQHFGENI